MKEVSGKHDAWDVDQIFAFAEVVLGSKEKSQEWMRTEGIALISARPIDLLSTPEGRQWVGEVLEKIWDGFP